MKKIFLMLILAASVAMGAQLGYTTAASTYNNAVKRYFTGYSVTPASDGTATRIWIYTSPSVPKTNRCKLAIYDGVTTGSNLLASGELVNAKPGYWNCVTINLSLTSGTPIYPVMIPQSPVTHGIMSTTAGAPANSFYSINSVTYASEPRAALETNATAAATFISMFVDYNPSGTQYNLTVNNDGNGTTATAGTYTVTSGDATTISALPSAGYYFNNWTVTSGSATISDANSSYTTVTATSDAVIQANFTAIPTAKKILPLGNSITEGHATYGTLSYRKVLQDSLGIGSFDFVGSRTSTISGSYDNNHAGVGGNTIAQGLFRLYSELERWMYNSLTGSSVLIELGANNTSVDTTSYTSGPVTDYAKMIDIIHEFDANINIMCATVTPNADATRGPRVVVLNRKLDSMLTIKKAAYGNVYIIDVYDAFVADENWRTSLMSADGLHPNNAGDALIAEMWYDTLEQFNATVPVITEEPTNQTVDENHTATFTLTATGADSYQWKRINRGEGTSNNVGTNSNTYAFTTVLSDSAARFWCIATNTYGADTSDTVMLHVNDTIIAWSLQPINDTITGNNQEVSFTGIFSYAPDGEYVWRDAATDEVLSFGANPLVFNANIADTALRIYAIYFVGETPYSSDTVRIVYTPLTCVTPSIDSLSDTLTYTGNTITVYGTDFTDVTAAILNNREQVFIAFDDSVSVTWTDIVGPGTYDFWLTNSCGDNSDTVQVTILAPGTPIIVSQPQSITLPVGSNAIFTVAATGDGVLYKGYVNGDSVSPVPAVMIENITVDNDGDKIWFKAYTGSGDTAFSDTAILTIYQSPITITTQPRDTAIVNRGVVNFSVVATGPETIHYRAVVNDSVYGDTNYISWLADTSDDSSVIIFKVWSVGNDTVRDTALLTIIYADSLRPNPWYYGKVFSIYGANLTNGDLVLAIGDTLLGSYNFISSGLINDTIPSNMPRGKYPFKINGVTVDSIRVFVPKQGW